MANNLDGKSMFVTKDHATSLNMNGRKAHPRHSKVFFADHKEADAMGAYTFGAVQAGSEGTLLPISSDFGGVQGTANPYGQIVTGKVITGTEDGTGERVTGDFVPTHLLDRSTLPKPKRSEHNEYLDKQIAEFTGGEPAGQGADIVKDDLFKQADPDKPSVGLPEGSMPVSGKRNKAKKQKQDQTTPAPLTPAPTPAASSTERVIMTGKFGKARGKYAQVCVDSNFVVLIYALDESVYTPPTSDEVFMLSCESGDYAVYFAGIEFELPFMNSGVQVMVRTD